MDPVTGSLIGAGMKLLGGLFGKKKKSMTPGRSIVSSAKGAREAAEKYGFNALTLLQNSNLTAGAGMDTGAPPLASLAVLGDIVEETFGKSSEDEAERREHNKLQNELLRLEVERARGAMRAVEAGSLAGGGAITGARTVKSISSPVSASGFGAPALENTGITPGRGREVRPQTNESGFIEWDNAVTGPLKFFGSEGEIAMEYIQLPLFGLPQLANNWAERLAGDYVAPWLGADPDKIEKKRAPYGRDAYGRPLPKAD